MATIYTRLALIDREEISRGVWAGETFTDIAHRLGRSPSTISREVWNNVKYSRCYTALRAHERAVAGKKRGRRPKKLGSNSFLQEYVYEKLQLEWSPEEIAKRVRREHPGDMTMRISHETIYQHLYCFPKGELKKELMRGLRRERKRRLSRSALHHRKWGQPPLFFFGLPALLNVCSGLNLFTTVATHISPLWGQITLCLVTDVGRPSLD